jgi:hypothetical protein
VTCLAQPLRVWTCALTAARLVPLLVCAFVVPFSSAVILDIARPLVTTALETDIDLVVLQASGTNTTAASVLLFPSYGNWTPESSVSFAPGYPDIEPASLVSQRLNMNVAESRALGVVWAPLSIGASFTGGFTVFCAGRSSASSVYTRTGQLRAASGLYQTTINGACAYRACGANVQVCETPPAARVDGTALLAVTMSGVPSFAQTLTLRVTPAFGPQNSVPALLTVYQPAPTTGGNNTVTFGAIDISSLAAGVYDVSVVAWYSDTLYTTLDRYLLSVSASASRMAHLSTALQAAVASVSVTGATITGTGPTAWRTANDAAVMSLKWSAFPAPSLLYTTGDPWTPGACAASSVNCETNDTVNVGCTALIGADYNVYSGVW